MTSVSLTPPRSLVHDTVYRRLRRRTIGLLHDIDDRLSGASHDRKSILFEAGSPMNVAIMRPVIDRFRNDPRLELYFTAPAGAWQPEEVFGRVETVARVLHYQTAAWMKFDAYVNADFWDMTWLHRRTCRIHLFHGVAGKYGLDAPVDIAPVVAAFDCLMFANRDRRTRYLEAGLVADDDVRAALVGYPKVDCLVDGSLDREAIARNLEIDTRVPTIIYAPTWSPYSSLNTQGEEIVERIAAEGLQVIVKLHDRSYDRRARASGGIDWAARLSRLASHPLVRIVREPDASPFLVAADAMVSDHSSIAFEYMLLDRPIVVVDCPELLARAGINPQKVRALRSAADVVREPTAAVASLVTSLATPSARSAERRQTASELFHEPGTATDRAVALVYRLIGLPALAAVPMPAESGPALAAVG
jgi:hypothetical protein